MKSLIFICSPSLAILDSWVSVLYKLKKIYNFPIFILVPQLRTIMEIEKGSEVITISNRLFEGVIFTKRYGGWRTGKTLLDAVDIAKKTSRLSDFLRLHEIEIESYLNERNIVGVLYDIQVESKPYLAKILPKFKNLPKFSIDHGCGIGSEVAPSDTLQYLIKKMQRASTELKPRISQFCRGKPPLDKENAQIIGDRSDVTVFLYSDLQLSIYTDFKINSGSFRLVGIPRHEPFWINKIVNEINMVIPDGFRSDYILVVSRPENSTYLPRDRKMEYLRDIKDIAHKLGKKIIVKPHPKESLHIKRRDDVYKIVLRDETYGLDWMFSSRHIFSLAKNAFFVVYYFSSTSPDFANLNVPVVCRANLNGLPAYDKKGSLRDKFGNVVPTSVALGLSLHAKDKNEFEEVVWKIISDRKRIVRAAKISYNRVFPTISDINLKIAREIACVRHQRNLLKQ